MTYDKLLAEIDRELQITHWEGWHEGARALRAVVELHKPYVLENAPHKVAVGWCKGCSIEYSIDEYASHPYPCPTIQAIEKELG